MWLLRSCVAGGDMTEVAKALGHQILELELMVQSGPKSTEAKWKQKQKG